MNTLNTTADYFPRASRAGTIAQAALVAAAAGFTATLWLSMAGAGVQPRGMMADLIASSPSHKALPRVEVVGHRRATDGSDDATEVAGCAADRTAHTPG